VCSGVSFEVERVVETLAADGAQVALDVVVAAQMSCQQSLQWKHLAAHSTLELVARRLQHGYRQTRTHCKKISARPRIGYFVASFPYFSGIGSVYNDE